MFRAYKYLPPMEVDAMEILQARREKEEENSGSSEDNDSGGQ